MRAKIYDEGQAMTIHTMDQVSLHDSLASERRARLKRIEDAAKALKCRQAKEEQAKEEQAEQAALKEAEQAASAAAAKIRDYLIVSTTNGTTYPSLRLIAEITASYFGIKFVELISTRRDQKHFIARAVAILVMNRLNPSTLKVMGRVLGDRDHTTIIHAHRRAKEMIAQGDVIVITAVDAVSAAINVAMSKNK